MEKPAAGWGRGVEAAQSLGFEVAICASLVLSWAFAVGAFDRKAGPLPRDLGGRINPNYASAASLARLPGIGLTRARAIIALRERLQREAGLNPAFRTAEDLAQVKGIGPSTIEGIRAWLRFDVLPGEANTSSVQ
ncbi:MAG TPA: helix-hairpin-helix domain-containing protein [Sedimentisphaerales bacterium]|nr:helix-hairpin-helix domain-containing protein [Phycisphaerae bacterium]HON90155.1 helix-hairpin-helix domain-containing protein [Sedimentisphaerales bacterium]HQG48599.1 helix-hairpin-helix domain-containing protein [Sedimentisphaerales bacterium]HQI27385.1 helix-hairpin-helix domain-containing protein [Sedimentisphaerales bacterium]